VAAVSTPFSRLEYRQFFQYFGNSNAMHASAILALLNQVPKPTQIPRETVRLLLG